MKFVVDQQVEDIELPENLKLNTFLQEFHSDCSYPQCGFGFYGFAFGQSPFPVPNKITIKVLVWLIKVTVQGLTIMVLILLSLINILKFRYPSKFCQVNILRSYYNNIVVIESTKMCLSLKLLSRLWHFHFLKNLF